MRSTSIRTGIQNCGKKTSLVILQGRKIVETSASKLVLPNSYFDYYADIHKLGSRFVWGFPYGDDEKASNNLAGYFQRSSERYVVNDLKFEGKKPDPE